MAKKLINILRYEIPLYKEMLALLQEEKTLLAMRNRDELYQLSKKIETLVFKIKGLELARSVAVANLAISVGFDEAVATSINLTEIIKKTNEPHTAKLKELQSLLLAILSSIEELNGENSVIVARGIDNISTAFEFIRELSTLQTYAPNGVVSGQLPPGKY